jgi:hypothetical protein
LVRVFFCDDPLIIVEGDMELSLNEIHDLEGQDAVLACEGGDRVPIPFGDIPAGTFVEI